MANTELSPAGSIARHFNRSAGAVLQARADGQSILFTLENGQARLDAYGPGIVRVRVGLDDMLNERSSYAVIGKPYPSAGFTWKAEPAGWSWRSSHLTVRVDSAAFRLRF